MTTSTIKTLFSEYGEWLRWAITLIAIGFITAFWAVMYDRFPTHEQLQQKEREFYSILEAKELQYQTTRRRDLEEWQQHINSIRHENAATLALLQEIRARVEGISAQTQILVRHMERERKE